MSGHQTSPVPEPFTAGQANETTTAPKEGLKKPVSDHSLTQLGDLDSVTFVLLVRLSLTHSLTQQKVIKVTEAPSLPGPALKAENRATNNTDKIPARKRVSVLLHHYCFFLFLCVWTKPSEW